MHLVAGLVGLTWLSLLQSCTNAQSNADALWFQPGTTITKLQSTVIVPAVSSGAGYHAVWPGLENDSGEFVYQNVISDSKTPGSWQFWIEYCCDPNFDSTPITVYPGDTITSIFSLNTATSTWTDTWSLTPGTTGTAAGQKAQTGTLSNDFASEGTLDRALLAIELQSGAAWDFGRVRWTNLAITAATTSTSWCTSGYVSTSTTGGFGYTLSGGETSISGSTVTCSYSSVLFSGPG